MSTGDLVPSVLVVMVCCVLFAAGLIIMDNLLVETADTRLTVSNETLTTVAEGGERVATYTACGFNGMTVTRITNATGGNIYSSGNYTSDGRSGYVYADGADSGINNSNWNITYAYSYGNSSACTATNLTVEGFGEFGNWVTLIILIIAVAIILTIVIKKFSGRGM